MSAAAFSINCECGETLPVSASAAGTTVTCKCGRDVRVPRLSELRVSQGMDAGESNVRDTIARMIRDGLLPGTDFCAVTGRPTDNIMLFDVECERSYVKGSSSKKWGTVLLVLGFFACLPLAVFMWLVGYDLFKTQVEVLGRDIVVTIPLRISKESQSDVRSWTQSALKHQLSTIPIYARLFGEYPRAKIHPR